MGEDHTPTAVSFKLQFIKGFTKKLGGETVNGGKKKGSGFAESVVTDVPFGHVFCEEVEISVPFVANDFPAREATNRDNLR